MAEKYAADALRASDPNMRASLLELAAQALKLAEGAAAARAPKAADRDIVNDAAEGDTFEGR